MSILKRAIAAVNPAKSAWKKSSRVPEDLYCRDLLKFARSDVDVRVHLSPWEGPRGGFSESPPHTSNKFRPTRTPSLLAIPPSMALSRHTRLFNTCPHVQLSVMFPRCTNVGEAVIEWRSIEKAFGKYEETKFHYRLSILRSGQAPGCR